MLILSAYAHSYVQEAIMILSEKVDLGDGVVLYKQKGSNNWNCRIPIPSSERVSNSKRYHRFSTRTSDLLKAQEIAYEQKILAKRNPEESILFSAKYRVSDVAPRAVKELLSENIQKKIYKQYVDRIENHIAPYFSSKLINKIKTKDLKEYFNHKGLVSQTTINTEKRAFSIIFEYAVIAELMQQNEVPVFPKIQKNTNRQRDYFSPEEMKVLFDNIWVWIRLSNKSKTTALRVNLWNQMWALANSGLRAGDEIETIKYKHILKKDDVSYIKVVGGKNHTEDNYREIPVNPAFMQSAMNGCNSEKFNFLYGSAIGTELRGDEDYVFRVDNQKTHSSKRFSQYKKWLKDQGIISLDKDKTLYSFRHSYITAQLLNEKIPVGVLAYQVGSSIAMIDRYYSKVKSEMHKDEILRYATTYQTLFNQKNSEI